MRNLHVVTHPEATHHVEGLVGGWFDSQLTERGLRHAGLIADALTSLTDSPSDTALFSSDLTRCRQTAAPLAERSGCEVTHMSSLREKSYGSGEGRPDAWFRERFTPPPATGDRLGHDEGLAGAETMGNFARRVYAGMDDIHAAAADRLNTLVVTHGGAATMVIAHWLRIPVEALSYARFRVSPGSITVLGEDDYFRNRTLVTLNGTAHLDCGN